ncbi:MAG: hypothetical protein KC425_11660 [Anaerolineales bacterium]|nr:hypothetical protein [Anaerolineales bacterium]
MGYGRLHPAPNVAYGTVRLLYQTASREYVEFLRANNPYPGYNNGEILYDLWQQSGQSTPELMAAAPFGRFGAYLPLVVK